MLNKFIENIKNSTSKKKASTEEIVEDEEFIDSNDTNEKSESNSPKSNRNSMLIRVIVILGLAYVAIDHFVLNSEQNEEVAVTAKPRKKNKIKKVEELPISENKAADNELTKKAESSEVKTEDSSGNSILSENLKNESAQNETKIEIENSKNNAPIENINIAQKPTEEATQDNIPELKINLGEVKQKEKELDKQLDQLITGEIESKEPVKNRIEDLKSKISVEDSYIDPPSYDDLGRGLVYDCKEKRWVCVDKPAYVTCNKNMKYNKSHNRKVECAIVNVYATNEDCGLIQKFYVSTNKSTDFCD